MIDHVTGTLAEMRAYQGLADRASGCPRRDGIHVGGGVHVEIHPTIPGPGWTIHVDEPREHPTVKGLYSHTKVEATDKLDAAERAELEAKNATAAALGEDWKQTGAGTEEVER